MEECELDLSGSRYEKLGVGSGGCKHDNWVIFIVAPCMLIVSRLLFVQLTHTNCYKIVK
jgi:hypothetical protein